MLPCCCCCRLTGSGLRSEVGSTADRRREDQGIAAAVMVALAQWARPPKRGARAGVALGASEREGVHAACQSITEPWAIKRVERARQRQGGEDPRGGGGRGEVAGKPLLVGLQRGWTTMVRMMMESGGTKQQRWRHWRTMTVLVDDDNDNDETPDDNGGDGSWWGV